MGIELDYLIGEDVALVDGERYVLEETAKNLEAENAKLRDALKHREWIARMLGEQTARVVKLQELVRDMWRFTGAACKKYPRLFDPAAQGGQMVQLNAIDAFEQRMRELGVETNDV